MTFIHGLNINTKRGFIERTRVDEWTPHESIMRLYGAIDRLSFESTQ